MNAVPPGQLPDRQPLANVIAPDLLELLHPRHCPFRTFRSRLTNREPKSSARTEVGQFKRGGFQRTLQHPRDLEGVMRSRRRTPKGGVQAERQQQYARLIAQGVNNAEACRIVGINRKTGNRWRYGRSIRNSAGVLVHYAPVKITEAKSRSPRYLSEQERIVIADLLCAKTTVRGISRRLGRSPSTISREIRRNSDPDGRYRPHHAEHAARVRAGKPRKRRIAVDVVLAEVVAGLLAKRWSPEQVAHELRELFVGQRERWLCVESIYQAIYDSAVALTRPARRRRRRRRLLGLQRRGRLTAMRMITERPR